MGENITEFDAAGLVRRVRRVADLSQRDLAARAGVSKSAVGRVETGESASLLLIATLIAAAGMRLAVLGQDGREITPMRADVPRDNGRRRYPAHLDPQRDTYRMGGLARDRAVPHLVYRHRTNRDEFRKITGHVPGDHPSNAEAGPRLPWSFARPMVSPAGRWQ